MISQPSSDGRSAILNIISDKVRFHAIAWPDWLITKYHIMYKKRIQESQKLYDNVTIWWFLALSSARSMQATDQGREPICTGCLSASCYSGSPPRRTDNPLVHDVQFIQRWDSFHHLHALSSMKNSASPLPLQYER